MYDLLTNLEMKLYVPDVAVALALKQTCSVTHQRVDMSERAYIAQRAVPGMLHHFREPGEACSNGAEVEPLFRPAPVICAKQEGGVI
jgi:hypothetical protein